MNYQFIVEGYNHPKPESGMDLILHADEIVGVVSANTIAKIELEGPEYKFEIVHLEKNRELRESLCSSDQYGGIGVKFISPKECIKPSSPMVWVNIFSGKRVKCVGVNA